MRKGEGFGQYDGDHEGNHPPYPGVIIEEMIDSASQIGAPDDAKAMSKVKDPEVSLFLRYWKTTLSNFKKRALKYILLSKHLLTCCSEFRCSVNRSLVSIRKRQYTTLHNYCIQVVNIDFGYK